ncbi:MAG: ArnT family glycosyltransferase [Candidatus Korobacteraceae bacterium]|jgi:4-amino-4-deoxy-L-arabinose transferase-like glycosyltransferase
MRRSLPYYLLLLLVIVFFSLIRWHFRYIPLERDEGEFAYAGQLMLHGIPPYALMYSMKLPGTFAAYAAILLVFGQTARGIHLGLLVVNALTTFLIFLLGKRLLGPLAGLVAASSYALLSTSWSVIGLAGHATHFVVLAAAGGLLLLLSAAESQRRWLYFWSGLFFGLAFLMKQPGIMFAVFGGLYLLKAERQTWIHQRREFWRKAGLYAGGVVLPFALTCLLLALAGTFGNFWFWTFLYARQYATTIGIREGLDTLRLILPKVVLPALMIWLLGGVGFTAMIWNRAARSQSFFLVTFFLCSAAAVCPGLYFRQHYFILLLPAVALLAGVAVGCATASLKQHLRARFWAFLPVVVFIAAFAGSLYVQRTFLFRMHPFATSRIIYGANPFFEADEVAYYIQKHSVKDDRIAVLGSEPEIYFYADRRSATGYIYTYGLMEEQPYAGEMQKQMIREIETVQPEYLVLVNVSSSFGRLQGSNKHIFDWIDSYLPTHYDLVGIVDLLGNSNYVWGDAAKTYHPQSNQMVKVFRKKQPFE